MLPTLGPYHLDIAGVYLEDCAIEKQQRAERLILGGGGDVFFDGQMGEKDFNLSTAHVFRVDKPLFRFVEEDEAFDP